MIIYHTSSIPHILQSFQQIFLFGGYHLNFFEALSHFYLHHFKKQSIPQLESVLLQKTISRYQGCAWHQNLTLKLIITFITHPQGYFEVIKYLVNSSYPLQAPPCRQVRPKSSVMSISRLTMAASSVFTQSTCPFRAAMWTGSMPLVPRLVKQRGTQGSDASIPGSIHKSIHICVSKFWIIDIHSI